MLMCVPSSSLDPSPTSNYIVGHIDEPSWWILLAQFEHYKSKGVPRTKKQKVKETRDYIVRNQAHYVGNYEICNNKTLKS